jgi:hypothetical protein
MATLRGRLGRLQPQSRAPVSRPAATAAPRASRRARIPRATNSNAEPDFDDLVLNDEYYRQLGISPEELEEQRGMSSALGADPEGFDFNFDGASSLSEDLPEEMRAAIMNKDVYGPPVCVWWLVVDATRKPLARPGGQPLTLATSPCRPW